MPGSRITRNQEELYMKSRQKGLTQEAAAARTGISIRSGRSIEHHERKPNPRHWRTRPDPLTTVWDEHLVPLLEREPELTGLTLLEYLQGKRSNQAVHAMTPMEKADRGLGRGQNVVVDLQTASSIPVASVR